MLVLPYIFLLCYFRSLLDFNRQDISKYFSSFVLTRIYQCFIQVNIICSMHYVFIFTWLTLTWHVNFWKKNFSNNLFVKLYFFFFFGILRIQWKASFFPHTFSIVNINIGLFIVHWKVTRPISKCFFICYGQCLYSMLCRMSRIKFSPFLTTAFCFNFIQGVLT